LVREREVEGEKRQAVREKEEAVKEKEEAGKEKERGEGGGGGDKDSEKDSGKKEKKEKKLAVDESGDDSRDNAEDGGEDGAGSGSERRAGGDDDAKAKKEKAKDDEADKEDDKEEKKEQEDKEKKEDAKVKKGKKKQEEGKQEPDQKDEDDDSSRALDSNNSSDKSDKKDSKTDDANANADANNGDGTEPDRALDAKNKKAEKDKTKAKDKKAEKDEKKEEKAIEKEKKTRPDEPDRFLDQIPKTKAEKTGDDSNSNSSKKQSEQSRQAELRDLNNNPLIDADTVSRNLTRFKQRAEQLSQTQTTQTTNPESDEDKRFLKLDRWAQLEKESQIEDDNGARRLTTTKNAQKPKKLRRLTPVKYLDAGDYSTKRHRRLTKSQTSKPQQIKDEDASESKTDKEERKLIKDFRSNHSFGTGSDGDDLMDRLNEDFKNKTVTVPLRNDFKTEEDYRRLLLVRSHATADDNETKKDDDTLKPAEGGEAESEERMLGSRKRMNRILKSRSVVGMDRSARRLHKEIIQVARFERRLTKKINLLVKRSKDANRAYRKLQEMKSTPVKFAVKKDLTESLSSVLDKPKGIKETKVTRNSVESRNPVQRMKRLIPTNDAARKGGELLRWANLGVMMIALWLTV
jgi:hypothetical protein